MATKDVKQNVTNDDTNWKKALADAELGLDQAQRDAAQWRGTIAVIKDRIKQRAPWPGSRNVTPSPDATQSPSA